VSILLKFSDPC